MEADSTTHEKKSEASVDNEFNLPFSTCPGNLNLYREFIRKDGDKILEFQVVERLQNFGLLPATVSCPTNKPDCKLVCRAARVVDRVQWYCQGCGKRQPVRAGSFFLRFQCTIVQALQIILAWCEDAEPLVTAEHFGVKAKVTIYIFNKLDELAIKQYNKCLLGGENSVVLAELYPECLNRLSPDTTDLPHRHRILMLADTKHIPTYYRMHVLKEDTRKATNALDSDEMLKSQIEEVLSSVVVPSSMIVAGNSLPAINGAYSIQSLVQHCDNDMQNFLSTRIWRQAVSICAASRDLCAGSALPALCAPHVQHYLHTALYRLRFGDGFYQHVLHTLAAEHNSDRLTAVSEL